SAIPPDCLVRSTIRSLLYVGRDIAFIVSFGIAIRAVDYHLSPLQPRYSPGDIAITIVRWIAWLTYFWFQGLAFTGLWILGHEAGHGSLSPSRILCDTIGYTIHSSLGSPYYSWRFSHKQHHDFNGHMDRDQHFIPKTRSSPSSAPERLSAVEMFIESVEDTPIYQVLSLVVRQLIGFQLYLLFNLSGQPEYPSWTSHFNPNSIMFRPDQFWDIILSDVGVVCAILMTCSFAHKFGWGMVTRMYIVPWLLMSHWISMIVFLQHRDPYIPHYRQGEWTYVRGTLATMDRPFLGWQGKLFLHYISHCHVVHHLYSTIPFYHAERATEAIKPILGNHYNHCDTSAFQALWNNYRGCQYVDSTGDILFFRDKRGNSKRAPFGVVKAWI
ncbi:fatty acid desaturase-domain-containing protein, partial [Vararia minispora EC-137]